MIIDSTTDAININLSKSITTNQLSFYASYNVITSTSITPNKNQGTTNNTTAVALIPSPSSNQQHQLRHCSIVNVDTKPNTVIIQYSGASVTSTILNASILPNESIQYTPNNGWQVYDDTGVLRILGMDDSPPSLRTCMWLKPINTTTTITITSGTDYSVYLGRADRNYSTISLQYNVTGSPSSSTYAELAIYTGSPTVGASTTALSRRGYTDISSTIGSTGNKTTTVTVTEITRGDDIYAVFGTSHSGTFSLRGTTPDDLSSGFFSTVTGSLQPSTNSSLTVNTNLTTGVIWCAWQPSQW